MPLSWKNDVPKNAQWLILLLAGIDFLLAVLFSLSPEWPFGVFYMIAGTGYLVLARLVFDAAPRLSIVIGTGLAGADALVTLTVAVMADSPFGIMFGAVAFLKIVVYLMIGRGIRITFSTVSKPRVRELR
jgi:hypothetical protein